MREIPSISHYLSPLSFSLKTGYFSLDLYPLILDAQTLTASRTLIETDQNKLENSEVN